MVADPVRDLVYVADDSDDRIVSVDTDIGRTVTSRALASSPGALAVAMFGDRLFVAEPDALQIQVLSLPDLNPVNTLHVGFRVGDLVAVVNDRLIASHAASDLSIHIDELDAETGKLLASIGSGLYNSALFRTDATGENLYVAEGGRSNGPIKEYDVSEAAPISLINTYFSPGYYIEDFTVNESTHRIYTAAVDFSASINMSANAGTLWRLPFPYKGTLVTALSSGPIYVAGDTGVLAFGETGIIQAAYPLYDYTLAEITPLSLAITPNGHVLYATFAANNGSGHWQLTIIGASSLAVDDIPAARFTYRTESGDRVAFDAGSSEPWNHYETLTSYAWDFGDGATGAGATISHRFHGPGPFTVQLTVTSSTGQTDSFFLTILGASISGTLYNDMNVNGTRNRGEPRLAGWIVYLDANDNGRLDPGEATTVTSANGTYAFTGLPENITYHVRELINPGWQPTTPAEIDVPVRPGRPVAHQDFGDALLPMISGNVVHDFFDNGTDDLPLKGWVVYLYETKNGKRLPGSRSTTTSADGSYAFTGLTPGATYQVRLALPKGWVSTRPTHIDVTAAAGVNATGNDFGVALPASIDGNVFDDLNADGRKERDERGLAGWTVFLDANGNGMLDSGEVHVLTDDRGNYRLAGLPPGSYTVRLVIKSGWKSVLPAGGSYTMTLTSGEIVGGENFAVK
jgi:PKD repeat protein